MELLLPVLIVVLFGLMIMQMLRQRKTMKQVQDLQSALSAGDVVMTTAGLHGVVVTPAEATVDLEIAPGVVTTWDRRVIRERLSEASATPTFSAITEAGGTYTDGATGLDSSNPVDGRSAGDGTGAGDPGFGDFGTAPGSTPDSTER